VWVYLARYTVPTTPAPFISGTKQQVPVQALSLQGELTFDVSTCCRHSKRFVDQTSVLCLCPCSVLLLRQGGSEIHAALHPDRLQPPTSRFKFFSETALHFFGTSFLNNCLGRNNVNSYSLLGKFLSENVKNFFFFRVRCSIAFVVEALLPSSAITSLFLLPVSSCSLGNNALCRNCWLSSTFVLLNFMLHTQLLLFLPFLTHLATVLIKMRKILS